MSTPEQYATPQKRPSRPPVRQLTIPPRQRPAHLGAAEAGSDQYSTLYYEPWSPNITVHTPTEAEIRAAGRNPLLLSPRSTAGSFSTPPRFEYNPGQGLATPASIRSAAREPIITTPDWPAPPPPRRPLPEKFEGFLPMLAKQYPHLVPKPPKEEPSDLYEVPVLPPPPSPDMSQCSNPFAKPGPKDPYVGSSIVVGLTANNFKTFIKDVDAAFVLFYDPDDGDGSWAKGGIKKAALTTTRPNHVFAGVDCTKDDRLCRSQYVESYPTLKLYARGFLVNTYADTFLSCDQIRFLVEKAPVASEPTPEKKFCTIQ